MTNKISKYKIIILILIALILMSIIAPEILLGAFGFIMIVISIIFNSTSIYAYQNTPCEGQIFSINEDYIMLEETYPARENLTFQLSDFSILPLKKYLNQNRFRIKNNDLLRFGNELEKEVKIYKKASKFKIEKYYKTEHYINFIAPDGLAFYIIKDINQTPIYVSSFKFNSEKCNFDETIKFDHNKFHSFINANYKKEKLNLKKQEKKPFSNEDELFKISKEIYFGKSI